MFLLSNSSQCKGSPKITSNCQDFYRTIFVSIQNYHAACTQSVRSSLRWGSDIYGGPYCDHHNPVDWILYRLSNGSPLHWYYYSRCANPIHHGLPCSYPIDHGIDYHNHAHFDASPSAKRSMPRQPPLRSFGP